MKKINKIELTQDPMPKPVRAAVYARVSLDTESLGHSLSTQVNYYSNLIQNTPQWEYAGVYADFGISGTRADRREEFCRMLKDCDEGKIDIILTKSISRFARNTLDLLNTVRHLRDIGIEVRFEKENINTLSNDGELLLTLLASFAQEESRSISDNVKWGIRKRFEQGKPRNCRIYGYRIIHGKYVIDESEAQIVRRIFDMFLSGDSCYAISKKLTDEGVKSRSGKDFTNCEIIDMIRRERYTGSTLCQKTFTPDPLSEPRENNGELPMYFVEDDHPAIISKETFGAAQEEFAKRYGVGIVNGIVQKAGYLHHEGCGGKPHPVKHRSPKWTAELRQAQSEYFRRRDSGPCKYDFSHFIECENCGHRLWAEKRYRADGTPVICWRDMEHISKDTPKASAIRDSDLKERITEILGWEEFDAEKMFELLEIITVNKNLVTLHFKDGGSESFKYALPSKKRR